MNREGEQMEKQDAANPYDALQRIFHEPHRLAIMSSLCALTQGESFTELKRDCGLTDGNLSRHLRAMEAAGVITITKTFVGRRPRTTIIVTDEGRETFFGLFGRTGSCTESGGGVGSTCRGCRDSVGVSGSGLKKFNKSLCRRKYFTEEKESR